MRLLLPALLAVTVLFEPALSQSPPELTPQQQEKLKDRQSLIRKMNESKNDGKIDDALEAAQKILALEQNVLGETHADCLASMRRIAELHELANDYKRAKSTWESLLALQVKVHGKTHWQTAHARFGIKNAEQMLGLNPEQKAMLERANALARQVDSAPNTKKEIEEIPAATKVVELRKAVLGNNHLSLIRSLNILANLHRLDKHFEKAEPLYMEAIRIEQEILGEDHPDCADSWNSLGVVYGDFLNQFEKAEPCYLKALRIRKKTVGANHPDYITDLNNLAVLYRAYDQYAKSEKLYLEVLNICETMYGEKHSKTTDCLVDLAELCGDQFFYEKSVQYMSKVVRIRKETLGVKSSGYASALHKLAKFHEGQGQLKRAEALYLEAREIRKEVLGVKDPDYADTLNNLAGVYASQGQYHLAEDLYLDAMQIRKQARGEKSSDYAASLNNLAVLYGTQGQSAKAEPLYLEALRINKAIDGEKTSTYATSLNSLGVMYKGLGQYEKAESYYNEALKIRKELLGEEHPDYARNLSDLGSLYCASHRLIQAESVYEKALKIRKKVLGVKHPEYAESLDDLADVYDARGKYAEAEELLLESQKIRKETLGEQHPDCAVSLDRIGTLFYHQDKFEKALPCYVDALRLRKEVLGEKHPDSITSLNNLGATYASLNRFAQAEPLLLQALQLQRDHLDECATILSEAEQFRHIAASRNTLNSYLKIRTDKAATGQYAALFQWHGSVTARQTFARLSAKSSPAVRGSIDALRDVTREMNQLLQNPPKSMSKAELAKKVQELDTQRESLEKKIARESEDFALYRARRDLSSADLQKSLPGDTALIEFFVHGHRTSAFVVTRKSLVHLQMSTSEEIEKKIETFLGDLNLQRTRPVVGEPADDVAFQIREQIWSPLEKHLKDVNRVLICPDGVFCRLPFAALPGRDPKKYLLEELSIVVVPVPQLLPGLLAAEAKGAAAAPTLLAVGDVDFNGEPAPGEQPAKPLPAGLTRSGNGLSWAPLPNTKGEVETIETLFGKQANAKVLKLTGRNATEAALERELPNHRFVHLATHGFFTQPKMVRQFKESQASGDQILIPSIPPGLSSGIVCTGANKPTFQNAGVLTATQIAELDLRRVELAVLSACETGLGELSVGEGVLGLQRAFQVAGARSVISTLWGVPDQSTAEVMKRMYANRLEKGMGMADALREAQIWVLNNGDKVGAFDEPQRANKRTPPKFWAAFTLAGDGK